MDFLLLTKATTFIIGPVASALGYIMDFLFKFTSSFGIMNIGLCIILFTLVVKLILFPLTIKQQKSSKLMNIMNPEMQAIQAKYKGKKDEDSMRKQQVEIQDLYQKYGTSPTGGCLQLLIQMPILFALYRVIYNIPAYVSSVRIFFDNIVTPLQTQPDMISKITDLATNHAMSPEKYDFLASNGDALVDLLYKFTPSNWEALESAFPAISDIISKNSEAIISMNSFGGINLAVAPAAGGLVPSIAWLIPILAGLTQWFSAKLMTAGQPQQSADNPAANSMKTMNTVMPLMSAFFCISFPAGIGIYWIASSVFQILQQIAVNKYMDKVDVNEMIAKNVEKQNAKRAKRGLPPANISKNANTNVRNIQAQPVKKEKEADPAEREERIKKSTEYYNNTTAKPGSMAAKAQMVKRYNEKHNK